PMVTAAAATTNIALNVALIPRFGMMGAAWATVAGYAVMAVLGGSISHRLYPIPLEWASLLRIAAAALATFLLSTLAPAAALPALAVKSALLAAFALALITLGVLRWPPGGMVEVEGTRI